MGHKLLHASIDILDRQNTEKRKIERRNIESINVGEMSDCGSQIEGPACCPYV